MTEAIINDGGQLFTSRAYPCGCTAAGAGDVPNYCPCHGIAPRDEFDWSRKEVTRRLNETKDAVEALYRAFAWSDSKFGADYWSTVVERLNGVVAEAEAYVDTLDKIEAAFQEAFENGARTADVLVVDTNAIPEFDVFSDAPESDGGNTD